MKHSYFIGFLPCILAVFITSCFKGNYIKDVDFPATPVQVSKIKKVGKACFRSSPVSGRGRGSILAAAKKAGINTIHMIEYSEEFEEYGFVRKYCVYVYGE